jgi:hypothetical protein
MFIVCLLLFSRRLAQAGFSRAIHVLSQILSTMDNLMVIAPISHRRIGFSAT